MNNRRIIIFTIFIIVVLFILLILIALYSKTPSPTELISIIISSFAIIISVITFARTQLTNTMPVLVFVRVTDKKWQVQNVGVGPAINVIIASRVDTKKWDTVLFPPIPPGASFDLISVINGKEYGAFYNDIKRNKYSSTCINNFNEFFESDRFPEWKAYSTNWDRIKTREDIKKYF